MNRLIERGDMIQRLDAAGKVLMQYRVLGRTSRGKLRLLTLDPNRGHVGKEKTAWWSRSEDLPKRYRLAP